MASRPATGIAGKQAVNAQRRLVAAAKTRNAARGQADGDAKIRVKARQRRVKLALAESAVAADPRP